MSRITGTVSIPLTVKPITKVLKGNESLDEVTVGTITGSIPSGAVVTGGSLAFSNMACYQTNKVYWKVTLGSDTSTILAQTGTMPYQDSGSMSCGFTALDGAAVYSAALNDNLWLRFFGGGTANAINLRNNNCTLTINYYYDQEDTRTPSTCTFSSSVAAGSSLSVTISSESSSYTHQIVLAIDETYYTTSSFAAGVSSGTISIPISWCSAIPDETSVSVGLVLYTYNDSTLVGTTSGVFTMTVPASVVPTLGDPTAAIASTAVSGKYVQNKSTVRITAGTAAGAYGSSIVSYTFSGPNLSYSGSNNYAVSDTIASSGTLTYTVTTIDSRGRSTSKTVSITVLAYSAPAITAYSAIRANDQGTASESGTSILVNCSCTCSSVDDSNSVTWSWKYKKVTDSTWTNGASGIASGTASRIDSIADVSYTYQVQITATDALNGETSVTVNVLTPGVVIFLEKNGTGLGIGTKTSAQTSGGTSKGALHVDISADWNIWHGDYLIPMIHVGSTAPSDTNALWLKPVS